MAAREVFPQPRGGVPLSLPREVLAGPLEDRQEDAAGHLPEAGKRCAAGFVVPCQATVLHQPAEGPLDHPPIGARLPALHQYAPAFTAAHRTALYGLAPGRPSPAVSWLRSGAPDPEVLAALERAELLAALRDARPGAAAHTAAALLADPALLGDPATFWAELATGAGGVEATVLLLTEIASRTPRTDGPLPPHASSRLAAAADLWRAALTADLPPGALAGAGAFADAGLDEDVWLSLMRASADHTPTLTDAGLVAVRAARHPDSEDALHLTAQMLTQPAGTGQNAVVRRYARALLDAATAQPQDERPSEVHKLRTALVNAGDVDAATRG